MPTVKIAKIITRHNAQCIDTPIENCESCKPEIEEIEETLWVCNTCGYWMGRNGIHECHNCGMESVAMPYGVLDYYQEFGPHWEPKQRVIDHGEHVLKTLPEAVPA